MQLQQSLPQYIIISYSLNLYDYCNAIEIRCCLGRNSDYIF